MRQINMKKQNAARVLVPIVRERYIKIKKIRPIGFKPVYNMEVQDHHNFLICDGLVVHNCIDAARYGLESVMPARFKVKAVRSGLY